MVFDYKKEYKRLYYPGTNPEIIDIPTMNFIAIRGAGDPNEEGSAYKQSVSILYAVSYTIKMSYKGQHKIDGFFEYVVPPLEGFWWQEGIHGVDYSKKDTFNWISVIRLPDFVSKEDLDWAKQEVYNKKKIDCSKAEFFIMNEGLCVQVMHIGPFDDEPATIKRVDEFIKVNGYENDFSNNRFHHEIYLSDIRKVEPNKYKTIIRHPVRIL